MQTVALEHEAAIRLAFFAGVFAVMGIWEVAAPRRAFALPRSKRWPGNVALVILDAFALRIVFPGAAVGMAVLAEQRGWGHVISNAPRRSRFSCPCWRSIWSSIYST
jgi:hypothetical protein